MSKVYKVFVPEDALDKFKGREGELFTETLVDEETRAAFQAKIMVSQSPQEGYDELVLQGRGGFVSGQWYVKIVEREEEAEEAVTVFEAKRLGARRGYMLRSAMAEGEKSSEKEATAMELEKRMKRRQEITTELLKGRE